MWVCSLKCYGPLAILSLWIYVYPLVVGIEESRQQRRDASPDSITDIKIREEGSSSNSVGCPTDSQGETSVGEIAVLPPPKRPLQLKLSQFFPPNSKARNRHARAWMRIR